MEDYGVHCVVEGVHDVDVNTEAIDRLLSVNFGLRVVHWMEGVDWSGLYNHFHFFLVTERILEVFDD